MTRALWIDIDELEQELAGAENGYAVLRATLEYVTERGAAASGEPAEAYSPVTESQTRRSRTAGARDIDLAAEVLRLGGEWNARELCEALLQRGWATRSENPVQMAGVLLNKLRQRRLAEGAGRRGRFKAITVAPTIDSQGDFENDPSTSIVGSASQSETDRPQESASPPSADRA